MDLRYFSEVLYEMPGENRNKIISILSDYATHISKRAKALEEWSAINRAEGFEDPAEAEEASRKFLKQQRAIRVLAELFGELTELERKEK